MSDQTSPVQAFLAALRATARTSTERKRPNLEQISAALGVPSGTVKSWMYGRGHPKPYMVELLQQKLNKISGVGNGVSDGASPAPQPPSPPRTGFTTRPLPIPQKLKTK